MSIPPHVRGLPFQHQERLITSGAVAARAVATPLNRWQTVRQRATKLKQLRGVNVRGGFLVLCALSAP